MRKKTIRNVMACTMALCLVLALSACSGGVSSSQSQAGGQTPQGPDGGGGGGDEVMGLFSSAGGDTLVIELVDMQGMMGGGRPEGAPDGASFPADGSMPEGMEPPDGASFPNGGSMPEGMEPPDGASLPNDGSMPQDGGRPEGFAPEGGFETTGETMEIKVTGSTDITAMGGEDSLSPADLEAGELLRVTLDEDGKTAVSIVVMRQTRGEQGA